MFHWKDWAIVTLLLGSVGGFYLYRNAARDAAIASQNEIAANDTTRLVRWDKQRQAAIYVRTIRQMGVELDKATRGALKAEGNAKPKVGTSVVVSPNPVVGETVHVLLPAVPVGDAPQVGAWLADSLRLQGPPITGRVHVQIKPDSSRWRYELQPDPIKLGYTLACGDKGAVVAIKVPDWARVSIDSGTADPTVCHKKSSRFFLGAAVGGGAAFVAALLLGGL